MDTHNNDLKKNYLEAAQKFGNHNLVLALIFSIKLFNLFE